MISYRPVPEVVLGRKGLRSAVAAMALATVIGTTAFAPHSAAAAPAPAVVSSPVAAASAEGVPSSRRVD